MALTFEHRVSVVGGSVTYLARGGSAVTLLAIAIVVLVLIVAALSMGLIHIAPP